MDLCPPLGKIQKSWAHIKFKLFYFYSVQMRQEAEDYKLQLKQKEEEAEGYKKQLDEMASKT